MTQRRIFLKQLLLSSASLPMLMSCNQDDVVPFLDEDPLSLSSSSKLTSQNKVLIIGAGLSGIYAAHLLLQQGADVQILEARSEWGGRIKALKGFADFDIELGAEEVHGEKGIWYSLIKSTGVKFVSADYDDYFYANGSLKTLSAYSNDGAYAKAEAFESAARSYNGQDKTVEQHLLTQGIDAKFYPLLNAQLGNEYGTSNSRISIKGVAEEDNLWLAGDKNFALANKTYSGIIQDKMALAISKITFNSPVLSIDYSGTGVVVKDKNGKTYQADKVVVTVPVSILKNNEISFIPALPVAKTNAIQKIGMGAGMKIIMKFSSRFWGNVGSIYGHPLVPELWDSSVGRGNNAVLTAFVMGEAAEFLSAKGNAATQAVIDGLDLMYGSKKASAALLDAKIMDWGKEPYIKGAYSFPIVGEGIQMRKDLASAINKKLFFAGEASHTAGHSGTAHGAFETGRRAALEVLA